MARLQSKITGLLEESNQVTDEVISVIEQDGIHHYDLESPDPKQPEQPDLNESDELAQIKVQLTSANEIDRCADEIKQRK